MEDREFGRHGLRASCIGLGCMSLTTGFYGAGLPEEEATAVIRRALELGVTLFNTSDLYGPFVNEILLGKALGEDRGKVLISTKWGPFFKDGAFAHDYSPEYCRKACEGALQRLGVQSIDLFTMRGPFRSEKPIEDTMLTLKELVQEGKIKGVGLSECGPDDIRKAHAVVPITAVEIEWSLFSRDVEADIVPLCRSLGIAIMAYSPLGRGMLTGKMGKEEMDKLDPKDFRRFASPRFAADNLETNLQLTANVARVAERKGCTAGQLALAWLLAQGKDVFPIPGTKRIKYLEENVAAAAIQLSAEEVAELESLVPQDAVAGTRYANMQHTTYHASSASAGAHH